jgi:cytidylate kinase
MVRSFQRHLASEGSAVLAGRDIGTVVAPDAQLKLYLDVSLAERAARRRWALGSAVSATEIDISEELATRDLEDSSRAHSPLSIAPDAVVVRTDQLSVDGAVSLILTMCGLDQPFASEGPH